MVESNMCLNGNHHLKTQRKLYYQKKNEEIRKRNEAIKQNHSESTTSLHYNINQECIDLVFSYYNSHALEEPECMCYTCYKERHWSEYKQEAYEKMKGIVKYCYNIEYPSYDKWKEPETQEEQILRLIMNQESFETITICPSEKAEKEIMERIEKNQTKSEEGMEQE